MYHQADLVSKELGLRNKLYSGFNDYELAAMCDLNVKTHLPIIIQSFGVDNENYI